MAVPLRRLPGPSSSTPPVLSPLSGVALAIVGALAIVAAATAVLLMDRDAATTRAEEPAPVAAGPLIEQNGAWQRSAVEPPFSVEDLQSTSFGLVAAAGNDGVWISEEGLRWRQTLMAQPSLAHGTELNQVMMNVKAVTEYGNELFAFGTVSVESGEVSKAWLVAWRSVDGYQWERIDIATGWDQVMDVARGSEGLTLFVRTRRDPLGAPCCVAGVYRSNTGQDWTRLTDVLTGLDETQLWAATSFGDGYLALGSGSQGDRLFLSDDGVHWSAGSPWSEAAPTRWRTLGLHSSAWALIDLFEGPDGVVAVLYSEIPHGLVVLESDDGTKFDILDDGNALLHIADHRADPWPPLTAPEGTMQGDQIVLLGEWFPSSADKPCTQLWQWTPQDVQQPSRSPVSMS